MSRDTSHIPIWEVLSERQGNRFDRKSEQFRAKIGFLTLTCPDLLWLIRITHRCPIRYHQKAQDTIPISRPNVSRSDVRYVLVLLPKLSINISSASFDGNFIIFSGLDPCLVYRQLLLFGSLWRRLRNSHVATLESYSGQGRLGLSLFQHVHAEDS